MDRVVFVMASGAKQLMRAQSVNANNLANVNTIGFQADLANFRAQLVDGPGYESRAYALGENAGARFEKGTIQSTGRPLDVAVNGDGWIAVQAMDGTEAYTRAGNLRVNINGQLLTGAGHPVMGESGPIVIPEFEKLEIGRDGTISVRPIGQQPSTLAEVGRIKLVAPEHSELVKGEDGLLRTRTGGAAPATTEVTLLSGALESSNVNSVEALVDMIGLARQYEMSVKIMQTAKEMDEQTAQLMSLG
ncbi:MAG: flagellar basal-body rod protein FlgF [Gammaproteobacteria bacterium]|jgi:flagellar basal-body rod protein FlgF|nr:MAG: flagellar basal-body rod protein FlgF [Gammaproteobacteria bacterium]